MEFSPKTNTTNEWSPIPEAAPVVTTADIWNPDGTPNTRPFGVKSTLEPSPDGYGMIDPNSQETTRVETKESKRARLNQKIIDFGNAARAMIIVGGAAWAGAETIKPGITQDAYETTQKVFEHTPGGPLTIAIGSAALLGASLWAKLRQSKESSSNTTSSPER